MATLKTPVLKVRQLTTSIRRNGTSVPLVDHLSITVGHGDLVALVGETGCGKSMTCLSIGGLLPRDVTIESGQIELNGRDMVSISPVEYRKLRGREFSMVFQDPLTSLNPTMRVGAQIMEPVLVHRLGSKREAASRATELLRLVGFEHPKDVANAYPHELSGGMRQRAVIAMALACVPKLLIADEPTTALDATVQAQVLELLKEIQSQLNLAILFVTHDLRIVSQVADRVTVMYAGREIESGVASNVMTHPHHPYTIALLGSTPEVAIAAGTRLEQIVGMVPEPANMPQGCRFHPRCAFADKLCASEEPLVTGTAQSRWACWHPREDTDLTPLAATPSIRPANRADESAPCGAFFPDQALIRANKIRRVFPVGKRSIFRGRCESVVAVDDVSLEIGRCETVGLVGETGSGKSTLGRMLVALEVLDGGSVQFDGVDLASIGKKELRQMRRRFQMMFQDPYSSLDRRMRILDIVAEPLVIHSVSSGTAAERSASEMLDRVGLSSSLGRRFPRELSGGQRQRVGLARALMLHPQLIVADEPVSSLDVSVQARILNLMQDIQKEQQLSYLFISHDLAVVRYMASRVGVMYLGRLVETGDATSLYESPAHPYTKELLTASVGRLDWLSHAQPRPTGLADNSRAGCLYRERCQFADARCVTEVPRLMSYGRNRNVACHHPLAGPGADAGPGGDGHDTIASEEG